MLREAVESVLAQTYRPIEIIISDDGSTDETPRVAQSLANEYSDVIRYVRNENRGPGPAREAGRQLARGEFIQYLDSDDLLLPRKFKLQVDALRAAPHCDIAYGWTHLQELGVRSNIRPYKWTGRTFDTLFPALLVDRWWCTHTPLYRKSLCDRVGEWRDLRFGQDWEYDARAGATGARLAYVKHSVSIHRVHSGVRQTGEIYTLNPKMLACDVEIMRSLFECGLAAGVNRDAQEFAHVARHLFSISRQLSQLGAITSAEACLSLAVRVGAPFRMWDLRAFRMAARCLGWKTVARVSRFRLRRRLKGKFTLPWSWAEER